MRRADILQHDVSQSIPKSSDDFLRVQSWMKMSEVNPFIFLYSSEFFQELQILFPHLDLNQSNICVEYAKSFKYVQKIELFILPIVV